MLPEENRLKKVRDFNLLMKLGFWQRGSFLDAKILRLADVKIFPKKSAPEDFKKQLKIAFGVGLKIDKRAVKRNRVRRQMREAVRLLLKDGKIKNGYYILLSPRKEIILKDYDAINEEIIKIFKQAGLFV